MQTERKETRGRPKIKRFIPGDPVIYSAEDDRGKYHDVPAKVLGLTAERVRIRFDDDSSESTVTYKKLRLASEEKPKMRDAFEVIVSNLGSVYLGLDGAEANKKYISYVEGSQSGRGRPGGESVTLMRDGEIVREYVGRLEFERQKVWKGEKTKQMEGEEI